MAASFRGASLNCTPSVSDHLRSPSREEPRLPSRSSRTAGNRLGALAGGLILVAFSLPALAETPEASPTPVSTAAPTEQAPTTEKAADAAPSKEAPLAEVEEKKRLADRVEKANKTEPKHIVARYEALAKLFDELVAQLVNNQEKISKADTLEKEALDLKQKKERALHLLEQTEARRARAELRVKQLEDERLPKTKSKEGAVTVAPSATASTTASPTASAPSGAASPSAPTAAGSPSLTKSSPPPKAKKEAAPAKKETP